MSPAPFDRINMRLKALGRAARWRGLLVVLSVNGMILRN